jgi:hypothetical protein
MHFTALGGCSCIYPNKSMANISSVLLGCFLLATVVSAAPAIPEESVNTKGNLTLSASGWLWIQSGWSCNDLCSYYGGSCNYGPMDAINSPSKVEALAASFGVNCKGTLASSERFAPYTELYPEVGQLCYYTSSYNSYCDGTPEFVIQSRLCCCSSSCSAFGEDENN